MTVGRAPAAGARRALRVLPLVFLLALAACKTELYTGLSENEADQMLALLMQHGIGAAKSVAKDGTDMLSVEQNQFATAVDLLRAAGFPHKHFDNLGDVFKSSGLVSSPMEERAKFLYAIGQELSATVSQVDGVLSARVEVVLPEDDILDRTPTPSSASVFIRYEQGSNVDKLVPQIKMLVADSVQGLTYDRVSVVLVPVLREPIPVTPASSGSGIMAVILGALGGAGLIAALGAAAWAFRRRLEPVAVRIGLAGRTSAPRAIGRPLQPADALQDLRR